MIKFHSLTIRAIVFFCYMLALALTNATIAQVAENTGKLTEKVLTDANDITLSWESRTGLLVQIEPPVLFERHGWSEQTLSVNLASHKTEANEATFDYRTELTVNEHIIEGRYQLECVLSSSDEGELLICKTQFSFSQAVNLDVGVKHLLSVHGQPAKTVIQPERTGIVRTYAIDKAPGAYFDLGKAVRRRETELAMPSIGLDFATSSFAVSADPYSGIAFSAKPLEKEGDIHTQLSLKTIYPGSTIPVLSEERTMVFQFHKNGIDGTLRNFYRTIPDIKPGPAWIHDIHLTFYDYIAETGKSLKPDLDTLAIRIPEEFRKHVLVCLHGYYDYLGHYSYNHKTKSFDDKWDAYDNHGRHLPMTKEELHRRMRLVKSYGFRVGIYYGDALAYDDLNPDFREDWILRDAHGNPDRWWYWQKRPDKKDEGLNYELDPSNPEVQQWFIDYTAAYVKEFGRDLDALVWDETHCIVQGQIAKTQHGLVHVDRAMMNLVAAASREVQQGWSKNPNLALLLSDNIGISGRWHIPFCLVAHGTWQDSFCTPEAWPPGMIPNYRNCLYSCNWWPIGNRTWNRFAVERYGLPQGLTNGYGDDMGPSEMPEDLLNETIDLFLERCKSGVDRTRYLVPHLESNQELKWTR